MRKYVDVEIVRMLCHALADAIWHKKYVDKRVDDLEAISISEEDLKRIEAIKLMHQQKKKQVGRLENR